MNVAFITRYANQRPFHQHTINHQTNNTLTKHKCLDAGSGVGLDVVSLLRFFIETQLKN